MCFCAYCRYSIVEAMAFNAPVESEVHRHKVGNVQDNIVTEGDLQLKELVQKQISTDVTLKG
jgi:hypothetical protein